MVALFSWWSLHELLLRFDYDNKPEAAGYNQAQPQTAGYNQTQFPFLLAQILISRIITTIKYSTGDNIK
jgi:hypothetical protein